MSEKQELLHKLWAMERENPTTKITTPQDIVPVLQKYAKKRQEYLVVVTLNGAHEIIKTHVVGIGILNKTMVHPREVFARAIRDNAASIILCHNHPSGNIDRSHEDDQVTRKIHEAGNVLGIPLLDHIIISKKGYYSYLEAGLC